MLVKIKRFFHWLPSFFSLLTGLGFGLIVLFLIFGQPVLQRHYGPYSMLTNLALYPFALAAGFLLFRMPAKPRKPESLRVTALYHCAVLAVQFVIVHSCWYKMGWDIANVYNTAEEIARGLPLSMPEYFQLGPNNAPITVLQAIPMWIAVKIGLAEPFVVLPYIDAVLLNLTSFFTIACVQKITRNSTAHLLTLVLSISWIALSPYILYPYTDTFAILFPVLALYCYLAVQTPWLKWLLISGFCFFGATIKPTVLIVLLAMVILGVLRFAAQKQFSKAMWKQALLIAIAFVIGIIPGNLWQKASTAYITGSAVPEQQMSETHYLMMGMNGESFGGFSMDDVDYSRSFDTLAQRRKANLQRAWERLSGRTLAENLYFFTAKAFRAYADGSFASHSSFLELETPKRSDSLSLFLRSLYHKNGSVMPYLQTFFQGVWLMLLTLCAYAAIRMRKSPIAALLSLTLLGVTLYLLLFEVWPRYLFLYAPFFVLLSSMAFEKPLSFKR